MSNEPTIIIDSNHLCWSLKYKMDFKSPEEKVNGIIFGFIEYIIDLSEKLNSTDFVFCWDSKHSKRKDIFPEYKNKPNKSEKEKQELNDIYYPQFTKLRSVILPYLGFENVFIQHGYESDDLFASIVYNNTSRDFIIVTQDEDIYQLLDRNVKIYKKKNNKFYTYVHLWEEYGVTPDQWIEVKSIAGCNSDKIPGVPGVGEVNAIKYIKGTMNQSYKSYRMIKYWKYQQLIERNKKIVSLPLEGTFNIILKQNNKKKLDNFIEVCEEFNFKTMIHGDIINKWREIFC